ncbi:hypothetical protein AHAS_Ahas04G0179900 [Arachis hypogaea]
MPKSIQIIRSSPSSTQHLAWLATTQSPTDPKATGQHSRQHRRATINTGPPTSPPPTSPPPPAAFLGSGFRVTHDQDIPSQSPTQPPIEVHMEPEPSIQFIEDEDHLKKIATYKAIEYVESGMVLGLGTGSTDQTRRRPNWRASPSGQAQGHRRNPHFQEDARASPLSGIPLSDMDSHPVVDLAIDGADEVDPYLNLVKGRGGSLLREKMVESACKKFVFTASRLQNLFQEFGCVAKLKTLGEKVEPYVTDNGNYIIDLYFKQSIGDLKAASDSILQIAGVVEHGMFIDMATTVIVAGELGLTVKNK